MTIIVKILRNNTFIYLFVILLVAILTTLPMFIYGVPNGNDLPQHYQFALTFREALQNGTFYPSWSAAPNYGFGDIGIRFYPPFAYYILVFMEWLSGNWFDASVLTFCLWFFISGVGVYLWSREWFDKNASLFAAIIYILAPYHTNQIYNAFTYAELAAASILPFCFLFVTRICRKNNLLDLIGLGIFYGLLVLTHLPMTVIGSLALMIYALASLPKKNIIPTTVKLGTGVFLGLLASAFYWIRMVTELNFLNHATQAFSSQAYDFHKNFLVAFLYLSPLEYNERSLWFADLMLIFTFCLCVPGAVIFYYFGKGKNKPKLFGVVVLMGFAVFIATPLSLPLWENFGALQKVQFPWRTLAIITLSGMIFAAAGFQYIVQLFKSKQRPFALVANGLLLAGVVFTATQVIKPAIFINRQDFTQKIDNLANETSYECWWTIWSQPIAFEIKDKVSAQLRQVTISNWQPQFREFEVEQGEATNARIATFYYPHWQATVNGEKVNIEKSDDGTILIPLSTDKSQVRLFFAEPYFVRIANYLSLGIWVIFALTILYLLSKSNFGLNQRNPEMLQ